MTTSIDPIPPGPPASALCCPASFLAFVQIDPADLDEFLGRADDVAAMIEQLQSGALSPDEFDRRDAEKRAAGARLKAEKEAAKAAAEAEARRAKPSLEDLDEEKQAALKAKVEDIMRRRQQRLAARERYEEYTKRRAGPTATTASGTDYNKWDMYTPTDEEDDLIASLVRVR